MRVWRFNHPNAWRKHANPDRVRRNQRRWRIRHRKELRDKSRQRYFRNIEKSRKYFRDQMRKWRAKNPELARRLDKRRPPEEKERRRINARIWSKENRSKRQATEAVRRARKRQRTIGDTKRIAKIYERASDLRRSGLKVVVDHRIPLARGGHHTPENLQIITALENNRKHCNVNYKPKRVFT